MSGSTYDWNVVIKRYPLNSDNSRGTGVTLYSTQTNVGQYFDMYVDYPGEGSWVYTTELTDTTSDDSGTLTLRSMVVLVAKR